ncbi:MAG TPA: 5-oxoprolinase subunit PxpA [Opitutaceae bacterium]|nr:5-oxoprolinase subunit PxpA [Opitutaceae bacterium]
MSRTSVDLNADVGEGCGFDAELVPLVSSVNIACGAHAGDLDTMRRTVALALRHGASIGAHPGFADREHFGRRELAVSPAEAAALVVEQARLLQKVAAGLGARIGHVKLHGALYNMAAWDTALATAVADALAEANRQTGERWALVALAGSELVSIGRSRGLKVAAEAFADRTYRRDGTLTPRSDPGAVIVDEDAAARQVLRIAREGIVRAADGTEIPVDADTVCLHGDGPRAVSFARRIRGELEAAGIAVRC